VARRPTPFDFQSFDDERDLAGGRLDFSKGRAKL
jgi:hypothetical protein